MDDSVEQYIETHIDKEPDVLYKLYRETNIKYINGLMASGHIQGRLLVMLCRMINPKRVLEIGTFTGYATICLAEGTDNNTVIDTIEINDEFEDVINHWIDQAGYSEKVNLHIGDAMNIIPQMEDGFDLVFMDMDKRDYLKCYHMILPKVKPGGFIIADNTLWYGKVLKKISRKDAQGLAITEFNNYIADDERVEKVILPLRDGLTLIRKK
jgi:predicted O-methyltransferase YrrM